MSIRTRSRLGRLDTMLRALTLLLLAVACAGPSTAPEPGETDSSDNAQVTNRGADKDEWWDALPRPEWAAFEHLTEAEDGWFEVYRVAPGVFALYEPGQFEEVISYLIEGEERALLFDTGLGIADVSAVVARLTELPVAVLNSHTHYDHVGGNHLFDFVYGRDTAYTRQRSAGLPHDEVAEFVSEGWIWKPTPEGFDPVTYAIAGWEIDEILGEGDVIDLGGRRLEVLETPGHAPDAVCLLDRENRLLFTGDTFYPAPLYAHLPGSDFEAYLATSDRLAGLEPAVDHLLPGHNVPWVESRYLTAMAEAFARIAAAEADFVETDGNREFPFDGFSILLPGAGRPSDDG